MTRFGLRTTFLASFVLSGPLAVVSARDDSERSEAGRRTAGHRSGCTCGAEEGVRFEAERRTEIADVVELVDTLS